MRVQKQSEGLQGLPIPREMYSKQELPKDSDAARLVGIYGAGSGQYLHAGAVGNLPNAKRNHRANFCRWERKSQFKIYADAWACKGENAADADFCVHEFAQVNEVQEKARNAPQRTCFFMRIVPVFENITEKESLRHCVGSLLSAG